MKIICEGVGSCRSITMSFRTAADKDSYLDTYCIKDYKSCEMCRAIMKKYGG